MSASEETAMPGAAELNRAVMRQYLEEVVDQGRIDALEKYFTEDVALPDDLIFSGKSGLAGLREHMQALLEVFAIRCEVEEVLAEDDRVFALTTIHGRQIGDFMGSPGEGQEYHIAEWNLAEFRDGKISRILRLIDMPALYQQLDISLVR
jgi:steroid delta-isomerase-like uncharacterized protein